MKKKDSVNRWVRCIVARVGGVTDKAPSIPERKGVYVERFDIPLAEGARHVVPFRISRGNAVEPVFIERPGDTLQLETEASFTIVIIHDIHLLLDLLIPEWAVRIQTHQTRVDKRPT
jgi:hypothetical protein